MKLLALFVSAFTALAVAQSSPNPISAPIGGTIQAGTATTITWTPTTQGTVTLELRSGSSNNLDTVATIAASIPNSGSFTWTPSSSLAAGSDYTIEILDDSDPTQTNFSPFFSIASSGSSAASSGSSVTSAAATTSLPSLSQSSSSTSSSTSAATSSTPTSMSTMTPQYMNSSSTSTTTTSTATLQSTSSSSNGALLTASSSPTNAAARFGNGMMAVAIGIGAVFAFA